MADRDLTKPDHLPKRRDGGEPRHPSWLPRQRQGITPQMIGRYPDYDVLANRENWDDATRRVVEERLQTPGPLRFFSAQEEATLRAFCDVATAQDTDPRVPVAEMVDDKLASGRLDGFRYANMPRDPATWQLVLRGLDATASERHGAESFADCETPAREAIVAALSRGELSGGAWDELDVSRAWSVCMRAILAAFYSHPWAWNEIGYGGPAYPQGYMRLGPVSTLEPHERHSDCHAEGRGFESLQPLSESPAHGGFYLARRSRCPAMNPSAGFQEISPTKLADVLGREQVMDAGTRACGRRRRGSQGRRSRSAARLSRRARFGDRGPGRETPTMPWPAAMCARSRNAGASPGSSWTASSGTSPRSAR